MDSNNSNITTSSTSRGMTDHFFPTSTTHFFDPLGLPTTFLDSSPAAATSNSWPPPEQTNNHPTCSSSIGAAHAPGPTRPRPSKKRSRASRRAPTTVLTTDPSNFRAMVQEFTGIPAPPFASLHFPRSMLNPPPSPSFNPFANNFQPSASGPINFHSQLLNLQPQPASAPAVTVPSSGELSLPPGVLIGRQQQQQQPTGSCKLNFPAAAGPGSMAAAAAVAAEFRTEEGSEGGRGGGGDGLLESWMCSSD